MIRKATLTTVLAILTLLFFGFSEGWTQLVPKKGGTITVGTNSDITTVDPHVSTSAATAVVMNHIFERLIEYGEKMELLPGLAERWEISSDKKTVTFHLQKGKLFHNGREMAADDVKFSIERVMNPKTGNLGRSVFQNIDRVTAPDKYTVRFEMKQRDLSIFYSLANLNPMVAIVPRDEVEKQGGIFKHPVGTGPYKFVEWKPDRYTLLERFDEYKRQPGPMNGLSGERIAYLDRVKFVPLPEELVASMALLNKEVDVLQYVPFKSIDKFRTDYAKRGIITDEKPSQSWYEIIFNCKRGITKNLKFRQACALAIDREMVTNAATRGFAVVNSSRVAVQNQYYTATHKKWYNKDLEKAKQLLKESGYNGEELEISTDKAFIQKYAVALAVQSELSTLGVKAKLKVMENADMIKAMYGANYDIISYAVTSRPDPVASYAYLKYNGFEDVYPRMKETNSQAAATLDFETRKKLFEEAHSLVYEGVPGIVFYNPNQFNAYWGHIKGFKMWSTNFPRLWGVWLDK